MTRLHLWKGLLVALLVYVFTGSLARQQPRERVETTLNFALPPALSIFAFAGDRYLAANYEVFRAVTVGTQSLDKATLRSLAVVQENASLLNSFNEDNYYTAAAILSWNGEYATAQRVLMRAGVARWNDPLPMFFHGFNQYYFEQKYLDAAADLRVAAERSEGVNRRALTNIAAKWVEKSDQFDSAIAVVTAMRDQTRQEDMKRTLQARLDRLYAMKLLASAVATYREKTGRAPSSLAELVDAGQLKSIPADPLGKVFVLNGAGKVAVK
ncbi:hypothetical protein R0381_001148 [Jeongeupia wiesaeckerbachi]|uniref:hypothetical protein n=1 Tax=Jeongeupia wiesaeckerbachi TaxID=3051218 RepID=UPI003D80496F